MKNKDRKHIRLIFTPNQKQIAQGITDQHTADIVVKREDACAETYKILGDEWHQVLVREGYVQPEDGWSSNWEE